MQDKWVRMICVIFLYYHLNDSMRRATNLNKSLENANHDNSTVTKVGGPGNQHVQERWHSNSRSEYTVINFANKLLGNAWLAFKNLNEFFF